MATSPGSLTLLEPIGQYAALQVTGRHASKPVEGFVYAIDPDSNNHVLIHEVGGLVSLHARVRVWYWGSCLLEQDPLHGLVVVSPDNPVARVLCPCDHRSV